MKRSPRGAHALGGRYATGIAEKKKRNNKLKKGKKGGEGDWEGGIWFLWSIGRGKSIIRSQRRQGKTKVGGGLYWSGKINSPGVGRGIVDS